MRRVQGKSRAPPDENKTKAREAKAKAFGVALEAAHSWLVIAEAYKSYYKLANSVFASALYRVGHFLSLSHSLRDKNRPIFLPERRCRQLEVHQRELARSRNLALVLPPFDILLVSGGGCCCCRRQRRCLWLCFSCLRRQRWRCCWRCIGGSGTGKGSLSNASSSLASPRWHFARFWCLCTQHWPVRLCVRRSACARDVMRFLGFRAQCVGNTILTPASSQSADASRRSARASWAALRLARPPARQPVCPLARSACALAGRKQASVVQVAKGYIELAAHGGVAFQRWPGACVQVLACIAQKRTSELAQNREECVCVFVCVEANFANGRALPLLRLAESATHSHYTGLQWYVAQHTLELEWQRQAKAELASKRERDRQASEPSSQPSPSLLLLASTINSAATTTNAAAIIIIIISSTSTTAMSKTGGVASKLVAVCLARRANVTIFYHQ